MDWATFINGFAFACTGNGILGTIDAKATLRCSLSTSGSEFSLHSDSRAGALFCFELVAGRIWAHLSAIARGNAEKFSTLTRVVLQTDNRKKRKKSPS